MRTPHLARGSQGGGKFIQSKPIYHPSSQTLIQNQGHRQLGGNAISLDLNEPQCRESNVRTAESRTGGKHSQNMSTWIQPCLTPATSGLFCYGSMYSFCQASLKCIWGQKEEIQLEQSKPFRLTFCFSKTYTQGLRSSMLLT